MEPGLFVYVMIAFAVLLLAVSRLTTRMGWSLDGLIQLIDGVLTPEVPNEETLGDAGARPLADASNSTIGDDSSSRRNPVRRATSSSTPKSKRPPPPGLDALHLFKDDAGNVYDLALVDPIHWGVFGRSGGGKGNFIRLFCLNVLRLGPKAAELWIVDYKGYLDYSPFRRFPQVKLFRDNPGQGLVDLEQEIERRGNLLFDAEVTKIEEYNDLHPEAALPYIVIVIDEASDVVTDKLAAGPYARVIRKGRALGLLALVSTQYPTVENVPSTVQVNLGRRLVFMLPSPRYTKVALGLGDKEEAPVDPAKFKQPGRAAFKFEGEFTEVQVPHLTVAWQRQCLKELREDLYGTARLQTAKADHSAPEVDDGL